jgi:glycosyltransferase involved in cell wall biosynthesis
MANFLSHRVTVNSKAVLSDVIKRDRVRPDKLVLIYNGINSLPFEVASRRRDKLREEMGLTGSDKVIIVVANLIPYKGHSDFLKAARLVFDHIPTALFWLVGDDRGIRNDLEHVASIFGIYERVRFMGQRCDIDSLLAVSNLAVLPSHEEGFSNFILESMAAGLPVVATVMAEKIVDLLGDPQRAISWGELGRRRVKELFSVERMVESHVRLYEERGAS